MSTANPNPNLSPAREAMARSEANANPEFNKTALSVVKAAALTKAEITVDDVRDLLDMTIFNATTHDMSAIGPVMVRAEQAGYITKIEDRAVKSRRPSSHGRLLRVFKSNLYTAN